MSASSFHHRLIRRLCAGLIITGMSLSLAGCGTLFYPERKGQLQGRVDPGVAVMDGLGLLLFIVPGVIAYAVDFSNNTIYLPNSHTGADSASIDRVHYDGALNSGILASMIATRTGRDVAAQPVVVAQVASLDQALSEIETNARWDEDNQTIADS